MLGVKVNGLKRKDALQRTFVLDRRQHF